MEMDIVRVELADLPPVRVTVDGVRVGVTPFEPTFAVICTLPAKLFKLRTVIVAFPTDPALIVRFVTLAVTLKSTIVTLKIAECESVPLVPVTVTLKFPAVGERIVRIEVFVAFTVKKTLVGFRTAEAPEAEADANKVTFPVKPKLLMVTVEFIEDPGTKLPILLLTLTVKSPVIVIVKGIVRTRESLLPDTLTV